MKSVHEALEVLQLAAEGDDDALREALRVVKVAKETLRKRNPKAVREKLLGDLERYDVTFVFVPVEGPDGRSMAVMAEKMRLHINSTLSSSLHTCPPACCIAMCCHSFGHKLSLLFQSWA